MTAQPTPEPWTIEHIPGLDLGATAEIMSGGTVVAQVWKTDDTITCWSDDEVGQANARLMIAASALLGFAEEFVANCPFRSRHDIPGDCGGPMCRRARAAIRAARGEA